MSADVRPASDIGRQLVLEEPAYFGTKRVVLGIWLKVHVSSLAAAVPEREFFYYITSSDNWYN
jgi:hypothetical protein